MVAVVVVFVDGVGKVDVVVVLDGVAEGVLLVELVFALVLEEFVELEELDEEEELPLSRK